MAVVVIDRKQTTNHSKETLTQITSSKARPVWGGKRSRFKTEAVVHLAESETHLGWLKENSKLGEESWLPESASPRHSTLAYPVPARPEHIPSWTAAHR
jgi:hypothetical protein